MFTNRCIYLLVLESTKIYIKIHIKMLLHVSVYDQNQGACIWAYLKLQLLKCSVKYVVMSYAVVWQYIASSP
jgi:hypothetical protein